MSSFSKKFSNVSDPEDFYFLTWESGYKNLKIYSKGSVIATVEASNGITSGVSVPLPDGTELILSLTNKMPAQLEITVNGKHYTAENDIKETQYTLKNVARVFWVLFGLGCLGFMIFLFQMGAYASDSFIMSLLVGDLIIVLTYGVSAFLLMRGYAWPYYLGTGIYIITTLLYAIGVFIGSTSFTNLLILGVRVLILVWLFSLLGKVIQHTKLKKGILSVDLLDSIDKDIEEL